MVHDEDLVSVAVVFNESVVDRSNCIRNHEVLVEN